MSASRSAEAGSSEHSSDVLAEAQKLILSLTAEVKKLRDEKRALNTTVDSLTTNCVQQREDAEQRRQAAAAEVALAQTEVSTIQQLNAALEEKCQKLQLLVQVSARLRWPLARTWGVCSTAEHICARILCLMRAACCILCAPCSAC